MEARYASSREEEEEGEGGGEGGGSTTTAHRPSMAGLRIPVAAGGVDRPLLAVAAAVVIGRMDFGRRAARRSREKEFYDIVERGAGAFGLIEGRAGGIKRRIRFGLSPSKIILLTKIRTPACCHLDPFWLF